MNFIKFPLVKFLICGIMFIMDNRITHKELIATMLESGPTNRRISDPAKDSQFGSGPTPAIMADMASKGVSCDVSKIFLKPVLNDIRNIQY